MKTDSTARLRNIDFNCQHCATPLAANALAAVRKQVCFRCGKWTDVPFVDTRTLQPPAPAPEPPKVENDLLKRASERLSTLVGHDNWVRERVMQSRQKLLGGIGAIGITSKKTEKPADTPSTVPSPLYAPLLAGRQIFPLPEVFPTPRRAPRPCAPPKVADEIASELHSFRQLSAGVLCPTSHRDSLPENVLFTLIALLGGAWPILAMFGVMAHR